MNQIYILKIIPKGYGDGFIVGFESKPTIEKVNNYLNSILSKSKNDTFKSLLNRCISGISTWGIPVVSDNNEGVVHWKDRGMSDYSSKGKCQIKVINIIQDKK